MYGSDFIQLLYKNGEQHSVIEDISARFKI